MSTLYVVDTGLRQTRVKVNPAKPMREVLEEACSAKKLDPDGHILKTQNNKVVDLSQPFRLSGLAAGAKLQLVKTSRSAGVVNIALQLPESEQGIRLEDKFPSTTSLWLVLRKFEDAVAGKTPRKLYLTQRAVPSQQSSGAGRLEYEQPVLNIANRTLDNFTDLQKTLSQVGVNSGNVLIRLSFRNSGTPLEEAMKEIGQFFSALDTVPAGTGSSASADASQTTDTDSTALNTTKDIPGQALDTDGVKAAEQSQPEISTTSSPSAAIAEANANQSSGQDESGDTAQKSVANTINGISVFRPPSSTTPAAALAADDPAIYEPTVEDAKRHQASLQKAGRNTRLLSDKELEQQEQARQDRLASVQEVTLRVRYPDQSSIVLTMTASETPADLYSRVMETLQAAPEPFELRFVGDKGQQVVLPQSSSQRMVRDFGFRGRVTVTMNWTQDASLKARQGRCLKAEYWSMAQDLKVELEAQQAAGEQSHRAAMARKDPAGPSKGKGDIESKLKKFMGFGKK